MYDFDEHIEETNISETFQLAGQRINSFVQVNYDTALSMDGLMKPTLEDVAIFRGKIKDIIRNNPPLNSIPKYLCDGREDFLWYSDFYDEISKDDYHRYQTFTCSNNEITPANYAEELAKIDLPYFRELIDLICLEKLLLKYEKNIVESKSEAKPSTNLSTSNIPESGEEKVVIETDSQSQQKPKAKQAVKRSYEPKLSNKQYALLAECIERIKLFRSPLRVTELKRLLKGKLTEPLQVTNQKSLVYLLDQLSENKYIKETWLSVADGNKDFISFRTKGNEERYGNELHYIAMQQLLNCRNRNKWESIVGLVQIEEAIEELDKYKDK